MKILITGGTGFIGSALCRSLLTQGHQLTVLSRRPNEVGRLCGVAVTPLADLAELSATDYFDALINLAGMPIADRRWSEKRKQLLWESRVTLTEQLVAYINRADVKPDVLVSGSAVGYYGDRGEEVVDEESDGGDDFAHRLCAAWEEAEQAGVRVALLRTGLVIGPDGGFLARMLLPFKLGLGGRLGDGQQWMSWIHRDDLIAMIERLLNSPHLHGPFNGTAPAPVTNQMFSQTLAKVLHRPALLPVPTWLLKTALGELSTLLLGGQRVMPRRFQDDGFRFRFETLESALADVVAER